MRITNVIWLEQFVEKIERKHHVSRDEVESLFATQPSREGGRPISSCRTNRRGTLLAVFFGYKKRGRTLVISSRDAGPQELSGYVKRKK